MGHMKVLNKGILVTIQDQGREQCQQLGLAEAGAIDKHAYMWGNRLLGNDPDAPALEILVGNCSFSFDQPTSIALTGADMGAQINGQPVANWSVFHLLAGDVLTYNIISQGLRGYLSIAGGFTVPRFFSSSSTMIREKTGGLTGDALQVGDLIPYAGMQRDKRTNICQQVPQRYRPDYEKELTLRFFPGYHFDEFTPESVAACLSSTYTVTNEADRMGYRLAGPALKREKGNILSIGVPCGAIQVPTAGEPIILLNDRQCTGGYPILGVVSGRDIYRLAQRKAGDTVRFVKADPALLRQEMLEFYTFFYNRTGKRKSDSRKNK